MALGMTLLETLFLLALSLNHWKNIWCSFRNITVLSARLIFSFTSCSWSKGAYAMNLRFLFYSLDPTILLVWVFCPMALVFCFLSKDPGTCLWIPFGWGCDSFECIFLMLMALWDLVAKLCHLPGHLSI